MAGMGENDLDAYLSRRKALVEEALDRFLTPPPDAPERLAAAMRYSLFAGGKRIRPILCMAAAEAVGGAAEEVLPCACALEMIHTYSLIHDDLPAMDNDDYRRGKPTSHVVFGEALAILAGDALLTEAFRLLADPGSIPAAPPARRLEVIGLIARAAGDTGMVGGQVLDVLGEGQVLDLYALTDIHRRKTGALLTVSVVTGALLAGADTGQLAALERYGRQIGLAFQIADDILNVAGDSALMGKRTGSDVSRGKTTFPVLLGLEASRARLADLVSGAVTEAQGLGARAVPLARIAEYIMERNA
jgi:geranylgeranyl diphosphate synthase type II